ncbi:site-specific integrase [Bosea rubneri]|uniref:Site-specific integrase n=1 Tax=Bosea rubneri TaxID=3075434 RepID=A0ABU3S8I9_9HYPH|nr:site-specific integrase [Bosea sp. ZW T0_25]MDU0341099.1 site-specific integrase [Bosea sp. ZW T0_25]
MYLHRRGAHWWFRKAVPSDLTGVLGRPDVRRSLRTRNAALARRRALQVLIRIDEVYAVLRSQRPMRPAREIALAMLDDAIESVSGTPPLVGQKLALLRDARGVIEDYVRDADGDDWDEERADTHWIGKAEAFGILEAETAAGRSNEAARALLKTVDRVSRRPFGKHSERDIDSAMDRASEFFPSPEKAASTPEGPRATRQMLDDVKREFVAELKAIIGDRAPNPDAAELKAAVSDVVKTAYSDAKASRWSEELLSKAIGRYDTDEIVKAGDPKHAGDVRARLANFLRFVGDKSVRDISRDDIRDYRNVLDQLPNRFALILKTRDMREAIALNAARRQPLNVISAKTINLKYLGPVGRLLQWLVDDGKIEKNPLTGLQSEQEADSDAKSKRLPFKPPQISALLALTAKETAVGPVYWFPPVILFTGMRLNELAQLRTDDLRLDHNGRPHLNVLSLVDEEDEGDTAVKPRKSKTKGRRVKSAAGRRLIPVHPTLIEMGFLEFVALRRKRSGKDVQVFPELKADPSGRYSDAISKRLNRRIRKGLGITNPRYTAYSLRHNFRDACTESAVSEEARKKAMGHQLHGMDGVYGNPLLLRHESDAVAGIRYPDVDMSPYLCRDRLSAKRGSTIVASEIVETGSTNV